MKIPFKCPNCDGVGVKSSVLGQFQCPSCKGDGIVWGDDGKDDHEVEKPIPYVPNYVDMEIWPPVVDKYIWKWGPGPWTAPPGVYAYASPFPEDGVIFTNSTKDQ